MSAAEVGCAHPARRVCQNGGEGAIRAGVEAEAFIEPGDLHEACGWALQGGQVDRAAMSLSDVEGVKEHPQAGAVHELDLGHIEDELVGGRLAHPADELLQLGSAGQVDLSGQSDHGCAGMVLVVHVER
nr:hypothetical protein [Nonomuraea sp. SYSU D8015]